MKLLCWYFQPVFDFLNTLESDNYLGKHKHKNVRDLLILSILSSFCVYHHLIVMIWIITLFFGSAEWFSSRVYESKRQP
jgi:hypothetical protein